MQKLLTLLITAAIIYMIFKHNIDGMKGLIVDPPLKDKANVTSNADNSAPPSNIVAGNIVEQTISNVLINVLKTDEGKMFFENILQPMNKPLAGGGQGFKINNDHLIEAMFEIKTFGEGVKGPASCGHIVTVNYKILAPNNMIISENTVTYPLGTEKIAPGVDAVIVGMKTGQTRHAIISSKYTNKSEILNNKIETFKLNVLLKEIMPQNFVNDKVKVFDDEITYKLPLVCGNMAVYHARITKLSSGEVMYDSKTLGNKINMQIGNLSYPVIFSYGLHNKIPVGTRTVIAPGNLFKSFINEFSTIFPTIKLPVNEFFMLELYDFENNLTNNSNSLLLQ